MLTEIQKNLIELNYLGSYIEEGDSFKEFEGRYLSNLMDEDHQFETATSIDYPLLKSGLEQAILPRVEGKRPVVFLSGGIDSTVLSHTLFDNGISFDSYAFFMSPDDPGIEYVKYLDEKYGINTEIYLGDYAALKKQYDQYFETYDSPNIDYALLSMSWLVEQIRINHPQNGNLVFLDGIEGDNLFGYKNNQWLRLKSWIMHLLSGSLTNPILFPSKKLNVYTSALIRKYSYNSLYQNFIFTKSLDRHFLQNASSYLNRLLIPSWSRKGLSFYSHNMLAKLFYMGRRVAYKNYRPITDHGNEVCYPYLEPEVLRVGFQLANKLKISPEIKYPLKKYLEMEGYSRQFVYSEKRGMGFDLFKVISFEEVRKSVDILSSVLPFRKGLLDYLFALFQKRDKAIDHFLFALVISAKYLENGK